ncbi:hypothetical protein GO621_09460 [Mucilaginibacter sp. HMF7410]|uniref:Uncharacterized protein n=1 Tax=Mucilaginibacter arboris TaxID=2682090 RepID=A0A7K1SWU1_9SPHI|nr:hypothetical protein [Mucilaginibacter arboris]MVN21763.1 hypothetical protein [Mucilaginibacter arboris]
MKANHNSALISPAFLSVGLNISNSKNESKSQPKPWLKVTRVSWVKYQ